MRSYADCRHGVESFWTPIRLDQSSSPISSPWRDRAIQWAHRLPCDNMEDRRCKRIVQSALVLFPTFPPSILILALVFVQRNIGSSSTYYWCYGGECIFVPGIRWTSKFHPSYIPSSTARETSFTPLGNSSCRSRCYHQLSLVCGFIVFSECQCYSSMLYPEPR